MRLATSAVGHKAAALAVGPSVRSSAVSGPATRSVECVLLTRGGHLAPIRSRRPEVPRDEVADCPASIPVSSSGCGPRSGRWPTVCWEIVELRRIGKHADDPILLIVRHRE